MFARFCTNLDAGSLHDCLWRTQFDAISTAGLGLREVPKQEEEQGPECLMANQAPPESGKARGTSMLSRVQRNMVNRQHLTAKVIDMSQPWYQLMLANLYTVDSIRFIHADMLQDLRQRLSEEVTRAAATKDTVPRNVGCSSGSSPGM